MTAAPAKKPSTPKKPAAKKPAAPKKAAVPKKAALTVVPKKAETKPPVNTLNTIHPPVVKVAAPKKVEKVNKEARQLYTFRLEPSLIAKLEARGVKEGITHAAVARNAVAAYLK